MSPKRIVTINNIFFIVSSCAVLLLAILRLIDITMAITFVLVLLVSGVTMGILGKPNSRFRTDERIRRLNSRALGLSHSLTLFGVATLYLLDHYKIFSLSSAQILLALIVFMPYSFLLIAFILRRFGDVNE